MAREQYLIGVDPEELKPPEKPNDPMTFKQKLVKFWYNYRVAVIIGAIVLVLAVSVAFLMNSGEKVDYTLVVVTKGTLLNDARVELAGELERHGEDLDGDGTVNVRIIQLAMTDPGDYTELATIFSGGTAMMFAMEPEYYQSQIAEVETEDEHYFAPLQVEHEGLAENGRYWNWKGSVMQKNANAAFPENLYFGVRLPIGTASGSENEQISADCLALLEKLIEASPIED